MTNIVQPIVMVGTLITSILVIIGLLSKVYRAIRSIEKWITEKDKHDNENYLAILRLTIMNQDMPLSERIDAGDRYLALGGNGAVKHKYEELLESLPKEK